MSQVLAGLLAANADHATRFQTRFDDVQEAQHPDAVTVGCSDSRVLQDHLWGNDTPGRLFTCSNIGNRVVQRTEAGEVVSGDVLYPLVHTDTELAIVVGHTGCGAISAAYDVLMDGGSHPEGIAHCLDLLNRHLEAGLQLLPPDMDRTAALTRLVEYNVDRQVERLHTSDDVPEHVTVVGAVYDFQDVYSGSRGEVHVINIDGERSVDTLRGTYPAIASRFERRWKY